MTESDTPTADSNRPAQNFKLEKIYLKDCSFESPRSPAVFSQQLEPEISLNLQTRINQVGDSAFEVVLTVTLEATAAEQPVFLAELHQAGIFTVAGFTGEERGALLGSFAPSVLFPYARETAGSMIAKGGFPQLLLQPVNFDALYQEQRRRAAEAAAGGASQ